MITGIDVNQTVDFVSIHDKSEPKTVWKLGILKYKDFLKIGSITPGNPTEAIVVAVKSGLRGVENFVNPIKFENGIVSDEFIDTIPLTILIEIGAKIMQLSNLNGEETKN